MLDDHPLPPLDLAAALVGKLNLADYQNSIPALRQLAITNHTERVVEHLTISVTSDPAFFQPRHWVIDAVAPGRTFPVSDLDLRTDGPALARLTEAEPMRVRFEVTSGNDGGDASACWTYDVDVLPRNHWAGLAHIPEMVAAFVQPNDPAIDRLLKAAAELLRANGKNVDLNGYGSGTKHAWEMVAGLWGAVAKCGITYALPPASFEQEGQKVRSPGQILESGLATCLDLALLFAAALEQAGLNAILVFTRGHVFPGCWLRQDEFPSATIDDPAALRKRLRLRELVFFESTLATGNPPPQFTRAVEAATAQIAENAPAEFELAVDIRRCRMRKIKPLSASAATAVTGEVIALPEIEQAFVVEAPPDLPETQFEAEADPKLLSARDRVARWQRKLLDLSLRNSLLNFRKGKKAVVFDAPDPGKLEDLLAQGESLRLLPRPVLMDGLDPRDRALHESREQEDVLKQHSLEGLSKGQIFVPLDEDELDATLVDLYRSTRSSLEEGGSNTLFLALGFLVWVPQARAQKCRAPLILIPVSLNRKSVRSGFTLSLHEDEPQFNPTLLEMLHQDFHLHLGIGDGELPKDESGLDVDGIWAKVSAAVKDIPEWEVISEVVLGRFSFAKHLMWKDLVQRTDALRENPVVRHLIDTPRDPYLSQVPFANTERLDAECAPTSIFCPLPADSSQLAAVVSAARGKDFVLIGPPGTGKSQTIANLISHCLAMGKRILFVAEKIAALDVVHRRLREVGLGQFCLEIHSSKAKKTAVLENLGAAWEARSKADANEWYEEATRLQALRDSLNDYVARVHRIHPNGLTVHRALGRVIANASVSRVKLEWPSRDPHDVVWMTKTREMVNQAAVHFSALGMDQETRRVFRAIRQTRWSPMWQRELVSATENAILLCGKAIAAFDSLRRLTGRPDCTDSLARRELAIEFGQTALACAGKRWTFVADAAAPRREQELEALSDLLEQHRRTLSLIEEPWEDSVIVSCRKGLRQLDALRDLKAKLPSPWPVELTSSLQDALRLLGEISSCEGQLSVRYRSGVALDWVALENEWRSAENSAWPLSWIAKKRIKSTVTPVVAETREPNLEQDLPLLAKITGLRRKVEELDLAILPREVWAGMQTHVAAAQAALNFQDALRSFESRGTLCWTSALDVVASGLCGPLLRESAGALRQAYEVQRTLADYDSLGRQTDGLWNGINTDIGLVSSSIDFCDDWRLGSVRGPHEAVARGDCGSHLQSQYLLLCDKERLETAIADHAALEEHAPTLWRGLQSDPGEIKHAVSISRKLREVNTAIAGSSSGPALVLGGLAEITMSGADVSEALTRAVHECKTGLTDLQAAVDRMAMSGAVDGATRDLLLTSALSGLDRFCQTVLASASKLQRWCSWCEIEESAAGFGLAPLLEAAQLEQVEPSQMAEVFETNYCRWWLDVVVSQDDVLCRFVSAEHEDRIAAFRKVDERYTTLTRDLVQARLCANRSDEPSGDTVSQWGILRRELNKKRRQMALRELLASIPAVITSLTPCFLMSPLSVAQFLSVSNASFDLVIFDEASQIAVWDAIGAIARAKQVVMVGDPKQLPPTNFFNKADTEEEPDDLPDDLESILDECIGANLPTRTLSWHYRSRHESLIAFSNQRYYGGSLVTFPSPWENDRAVNLHFVAGTYEKGTSRTNPSEARALVADVVATLRSPEFVQAGHTLGIVTFNTEQQQLIEDLLDAARRKDPGIEHHFADTRLERVFVKNLESVQGDERDLIYFSVTFGPDLSRRVSVNFGPMNRDGGERRLNVAITRARRELRVFSSLHAEDIDLSRTQATGVRELKHFLEFAEKGPRAFAELVSGSAGEAESPFERYVADALRSRGWTVHTQIGVSSFRIDLGVVNPRAPGAYLAGIECDGATYHRAATARDRDKVREQVLRDLGWSILRVWSTDWWIDPAGTLDRLDSSLRSLVPAEHSGEFAAALESARQNEADPGAMVIPEAPYDNQSSEAVGANAMERDTAYQRRWSADAPADEAPSGNAGVLCNADLFFDREYDSVLRAIIEDLVEGQGPILDDTLARRIARMHGWSRTGTKITERVNRMAARCCRKTVEEARVFYWPRGTRPGDAIPFRAGTDRTVDEICIYELVSLATSVLESGLKGEEALLAMAREAGVKRLQEASRSRLSSAIRRAQAQVRRNADLLSPEPE